MNRSSWALRALVVWIALAAISLATPQAAKNTKESSSMPAPHYFSAKFEGLKWEKMFPEFGADSPEICILRVDPRTQATQLFIRNPKKMHVPRHWHTANETHTILNGTFVFECEGKREELGPGSFNYIASKMIHQAWLPDNGLVFITVDSGWDVNWVDGPPQPPKKP